MLRLITTAVNESNARPSTSDDALLRGNVVEQQQQSKVTSLRAWSESRGLKQDGHPRMATRSHSRRPDATAGQVIELRAAVKALHAQLAASSARGKDVSALKAQADKLQGQLVVLEGAVSPRKPLSAANVRFHAHLRNGPETEPTPAA